MAPLFDLWAAAKEEATEKGLPARFFTDADTRRLRMELCHECASLTGLNLCAECGCYMPIKTWVNTADCPKNKWAVAVGPKESV